LIVSTLTEHAKASGLTGAATYQPVFYTMAGLLVVGLLADLAVTAVNEKYQEKGPSPFKPVTTKSQSFSI